MAISLNGSTQYLRRSSAVLTGIPLTMTALVKKNSLTTDTCILYTELQSNNSYIGLFARSTAVNSNMIQGIISYTAVGSVAWNGSTYSTGDWNFVAIRCISTTSRDIWYNQTKTSNTTSQSFISNMDEFVIGRWDHSSPTLYFDGAIAEVGCWNIDLSDDEMIALSRGYSPSMIRNQNLVAYYPLGGIYGKNSNDYWKNSYIMTEYGTPTYTDHPRVIYKQPGKYSTLSLPTPSRTLLYIPAYNFTFPSSSGAYFSTRNSIPIIVFDGTTSTSCTTLIDIPTNYSGGQCIAILHVVTESATSGNISFDVGIEKIGDRALDLDSNNLTTKKGYFNEVSTTSGHVHQIKVPFSFSQFGNISPGETVSMKITRSTANDSITTNVGLLGVEIGEI